MLNIRGDMMDLQANTNDRAGSAHTTEAFEQALRQAAGRPEEAQAAALKRILTRNADTVIGRRYGFGEIDSVEGFRGRVPTHEYHALRPMIEMQRATGDAVLSADRPATHVPASGAVRRCDRIPLIAEDQRLRAEARAIAHEALARDSGFAAGHVLDLAAIAGAPAVAPVPGLSGVADLELRAYVTALLALTHDDVTGIDAVRLETLDILQDVLDRHARRLLDDLRDGTLCAADRLPDELAEAVRGAMQGAGDHVASLESLLEQQGRLCIPAIWPSLAVVAADLTGDDTGRPQWLPIRVRIVDTGCELNELRATVAMSLGDEFLPLLTEAYFEFADPDVWQPKPEDFLGLYEIEPGRDYQVFVTTLSGLYRYRLKATARVDGRIGRCPTLSINRHDMQSRLKEKAGLQTSQVVSAATEALRSAFDELPRFNVVGGPRQGTFRLLVERREDVVPCLDDLADAIDGSLRQASFAYDTARAGGGASAVTVGFRQERAPSVSSGASVACSAA